MDSIGGIDLNSSNGNNDVRRSYNSQQIRLDSYDNHFEFLMLENAKQFTKKLIIEKNGKIYELEKKEIVEGKLLKSYTYCAFLGIINILDYQFLFCVNQVFLIGTIEKNDIFEIASSTANQLGEISLIPLNEFSSTISDSKKQIINSHIQNIKNLFTVGYYFSYTYDLTKSKQRQSKNSKIEWKYAWNYSMMKTLINANVNKIWIVPLLQGYIGCFSLHIQGKKLEFYLIARRSSKQAGTRYNARGIDDDGNVANFTENEQIIYYDQYCCSCVQIRGSVPVFWTQRGVTADTKLNRSYDLTNNVFLKHMSKLKQNYERIFIVDLLKKSIPGEKILIEEFEKHISNNDLPFVKYEYFDLHTICKQGYHMMNPFIEKISPIVNNFKFYVQNLKTKEVLLNQNGVFRTNCLDCLDRTNMIQNKIAMVQVENIIKNFGINLAETFGESVLSHLDNSNQEKIHPFMQQFKILWATAGDFVSLHYTGTGSTHSDVTKTGKKDIAGYLNQGFIGLKRFINQNFTDTDKESAISLLLGCHAETLALQSSIYEEELKKRVLDYSSIEDFTVYIVTWNVNALPMSSDLDLSSLFQFQDSKSPDLIVIGLQEIVELQAKNLVQNNETLTSNWNDLILQQLSKFGSYKFIRQKNLMAESTMLYIKEDKVNLVSNVNYDTVKFGFVKKLSNKGAVAIKLEIGDTLLCFINVHLESGKTSRSKNINDIYEQTFQQQGVGKIKQEKVEQMNHVFLFGDMEFELQHEQNEVKNFLEKYQKFIKNNQQKKAQESFDYLFSKDEFQSLLQSNSNLKRCLEGQVTFLPTYKYVKSADSYDWQVIPSWRDRIFHNSLEIDQKNLTLNYYTTSTNNNSEHRPVIANFTVKYRQINIQKKQEILEQIYQAINQKNPNVSTTIKPQQSSQIKQENSQEQEDQKQNQSNQGEQPQQQEQKQEIPEKLMKQGIQEVVQQDKQEVIDETKNTQEIQEKQQLEKKVEQKIEEKQQIYEVQKAEEPKEGNQQKPQEQETQKLEKQPQSSETQQNQESKDAQKQQETAQSKELTKESSQVQEKQPTEEPQQQQQEKKEEQQLQQIQESKETQEKQQPMELQQSQDIQEVKEKKETQEKQQVVESQQKDDKQEVHPDQEKNQTLQAQEKSENKDKMDTSDSQNKDVNEVKSESHPTQEVVDKPKPEITAQIQEKEQIQQSEVTKEIRSIEQNTQSQIVSTQTQEQPQITKVESEQKVEVIQTVETVDSQVNHKEQTQQAEFPKQDDVSKQPETDQAKPQDNQSKDQTVEQQQQQTQETQLKQGEETKASEPSQEQVSKIPQQNPDQSQLDKQPVQEDANKQSIEQPSQQNEGDEQELQREESQQGQEVQEEPNEQKQQGKKNKKKKKNKDQQKAEEKKETQ